MNRQLTVTAVLAILATPVLADHGNPWATEGDTVLSQYHDANQAKSIDTPGEAEMRGALVRNARGKLGETGSSAAGSQSGQQGGRKSGRN
ncbi:hypothetical protein [Yoonia maritima]|uniref:hypothetical protein n=1 Tax=Yoonia maritima TaxID=1435347 RepID=UPI003735BE62